MRIKKAKDLEIYRIQKEIDSVWKKIILTSDNPEGEYLFVQYNLKDHHFHTSVGDWCSVQSNELYSDLDNIAKKYYSIDVLITRETESYYTDYEWVTIYCWPIYDSIHLGYYIPNPPVGTDMELPDV